MWSPAPTISTELTRRGGHWPPAISIIAKRYHNSQFSILHFPFSILAAGASSRPTMDIVGNGLRAVPPQKPPRVGTQTDPYDALSIDIVGADAHIGPHGAACGRFVNRPYTVDVVGTGALDGPLWQCQWRGKGASRSPPPTKHRKKFQKVENSTLLLGKLMVS